MIMRRLALLLLAIAVLTVLPPVVAQSLADSGDSTSNAEVLPSTGATHPPSHRTYGIMRPYMS
jgi:hypothetical protein